MTLDSFESLLKRDRRAALREYAESWLDANSESRRDTINSLAAVIDNGGFPTEDDELVAEYERYASDDDETTED